MMLEFVKIKLIIPGIDVVDGAGVKLKRYIGTHILNYLDPFLLLDEFKSRDERDWSAGFPPHPHRGFQTLTYMISGTFEHKDSTGSHSLLPSNSLQWMNAGSGVIHSEMPAMKEGFLWGYQLWLNSPRKFKMSDPFYFNFKSSVELEDQLKGLKIINLVGEPMEEYGYYKVIYKHIQIRESCELKLELPAENNSFIVVSEGVIEFVPDKVKVSDGHIVVFSGNYLWIFAHSDSHLLLASAKPLREPVARWGPFVMNTKEEIIQAIEDYQNGRLVKRKAEFSEI
jgi:hypothetical protein